MTCRPLLLALLSLYLACTGDEPGDTQDDLPGDSDADTDADTDIPLFSDIGWELLEDYGSVVRVSWEQGLAAEGHLRFGFDEGVWLQSPQRSFEPGPQEELLLGVPYDTELSFTLVTEQGESEAITAQTGPVPEDLPVPSLLAGDAEAWEPSAPYMLMSLSGNTAWTVIVDRAGRVVWMHPTDRLYTTLYARTSHDGRDLLIDYNSYWSRFDGGATSTVLRMKIDGSEQQSHATPGLHHPFLELPDGSLLWGAADGSTETLEQLDSSGVQSTLWSCSDWQQEVGARGVCQSNTLFYDEAGDRLLYSFWSNETILELDRATGTVLRYFGHEQGAWGFAEGSAPFWWQHGATYTEAGTLMTSSHADDGDVELVVREYALDEEAEELVEIWSFGEGQGVMGYEMGDALRLPGGNTLHNYGAGTRLREVTPEGVVVWDLDWDPGVTLGYSKPLEDLYALAPER